MHSHASLARWVDAQYQTTGGRLAPGRRNSSCRIGNTRAQGAYPRMHIAVVQEMGSTLLALGPNGQVYVGGVDGTVHSYDPRSKTGRPHSEKALCGVEGRSVSALLCSAGGERVYVADLGGGVRAFDHELHLIGPESTDAGEEVYALAVDARRGRYYIVTPEDVLRLSPNQGEPNALPGGGGPAPAGAGAGGGGTLAQAADSELLEHNRNPDCTD